MRLNPASGFYTELKLLEEKRTNVDPFRTRSGGVRDELHRLGEAELVEGLR